MKLHTKLLLVLIPVFILAFIVHSAVMYRTAHKQTREDLRKNAGDIRALLMATRRVYHHQFIDSGLPVNDDTVGFLPAHALSRIAKDFQEWANSGVRFNNVSDRARNPENTADELEMIAMTYFRENPDEEERFVAFTGDEGDPMYHYTRPIWIEEYCLKCHGSRESAPESIGNRYAESYGYKLGDLRGVMSIKLPSKIANERAMAMVYQNLSITLIGYFCTFVLIYSLLVRQTVDRINTLEEGGRAMANGDYDWKSGIEGSDEISNLATAFEEMGNQIKEREKALAASESRVNAILEASLDPIVTIDSHGIIQKASASFETVFGWKPEEVIGENISIIMPEPYRSEHDGYLDRYRRTQTSNLLGNTRELEAQRKDGSIFPCEVSINRVDVPEYTEPLFAGTIRDITERKQFEDNRRLMMNELDHRVKNTLASVLSLFKQSASQSGSYEDLIDTFPSRIQSLAKTHEALAAKKWEGVGLFKILQMGMPELETAEGTRVQATGDDIQLPPKVTSPICMTVHELTTNARKYGALSNDEGKIDIQWTTDANGKLRITWRETQGPTITEKPVEGFGISLVRGFIEHELTGEVAINFHAEGAEYVLDFPLSLFAK